jgi:hypothetical protein
MRLTLKIAAGCLLTCGLLSANPPACVSGTLASYMALGAGGCVFGGVTFANFTYAAKVSGGAPMIKADQITVLPVLVIPETAQFTFSASWSVANAQSQVSVIRYTAVLPCGDTAPAELDLTLGPAHVGGIVGNASVQEKTNVGDLSVFDTCTEVCQTKSSDRLQFKPVSVLLITQQVSLTGGTGGASLNQFSAALNRCIPCV